MSRDKSILSGVVRTFLEGNLAILMIMISLVAGAAALMLTPREEEPQIVVPVADVIVTYPGGTAIEVEQRVASRLEKLLYQIDGVEYVYSMSRPGMAVVTVRFFVGQNREDSLIKLYNKLFSNIDQVTPGIAGWVVKPVEIDDVPVVTAALYSDRYSTYELYRVAEEVVDHLQRIPDSARITIHGGQRRVVRVLLDSERMAAHGITALEVAQVIQVSNAQVESGSFDRANLVMRVEAGPYLKDAAEVADLMVAVYDDRPVYLRDIADIVDGPEELNTYTRLGFGPGNQQSMDSFPAVTIAVAKKTGRNAVTVARQVEHEIRSLQQTILPHDVTFRITRDYGSTSNE